MYIYSKLHKQFYPVLLNEAIQLFHPPSSGASKEITSLHPSPYHPHWAAGKRVWIIIVKSCCGFVGLGWKLEWKKFQVNSIV